MSSHALDLLERYPTQLTVGDVQPNNARPWQFEETDLFKISGFKLTIGDELKVELGPSTLGVGHSADGAVWAALIPQRGGELTSKAQDHPESVAHVWLRFHPKEIDRLFPPDTVSSGADPALAAQVRGIVSHKFNSSWHAGPQAMIPDPKDLTVDIDTTNGLRRFFAADTEAGTAKYFAVFANRPLKPAPTLTPELAEQAFDQMWQTFDREYAMFVLRPEVDWTQLRERYRPKAIGAKSTYEFAGVCAEMLRTLRDLHIWLSVAGTDVPVFNRPRFANANPGATRAILGDLQDAGPSVKWAVTAEKIGYLTIHGWSDSNIPAQCDEVLEQMRNTRGLIVDVRLNGGGSEDLAQEVANRFLAKEFVYGCSQVRNGPGHKDLTEKRERSVSPRGPWRYNRPVVLLIGQKCMSSNESFVAMMSGVPEITIMGDHTCGSSGNPRMLDLPLDIRVSVPRWIDYLPDGSPLDERGFQPQVVFKPGPGAFNGQRDDLLTAAIERLRKVALPEKPIE